MSVGLVTSDVMANLPIFKGLDLEDLNRLAEIASIVSHEPGTFVLRQGGSRQSLFVVLEGECRVIKQTAANSSGPTVLAELGPRDHFGEMSFFHAAPHSASVEATTQLELLTITRDRYDELIDEGAPAAYKLALGCVDVLADRLRKMDEWVLDLLCEDQPDASANEWTSFREKLFADGISGHAI